MAGTINCCFEYCYCKNEHIIIGLLILMMLIICGLVCVKLCDKETEITRRTISENELELKKALIRKIQDNTLSESNIQKIYDTLK